MIAPNSISYAAYLLCASDTLLNTSGGLLAQAPAFRTGWQGPLVKDAALCPWIEVHQTKHGMSPHLMMGGGGRSWVNDYEVQIFHQTASWLGNSGAAFRDLWATEYYLTHSVFAISSNFSLPALTGSNPSLNLQLMQLDSELWNVDQVAEQTLVTNLITLKYQGQG